MAGHSCCLSPAGQRRTREAQQRAAAAAQDDSNTSSDDKIDGDRRRTDVVWENDEDMN
jgi:hypothetical protein